MSRFDKLRASRLRDTLLDHERRIQELERERGIEPTPTSSRKLDIKAKNHDTRLKRLESPSPAPVDLPETPSPHNLLDLPPEGDEEE